MEVLLQKRLGKFLSGFVKTANLSWPIHHLHDMLHAQSNCIYHTGRSIEMDSAAPAA